MTPGTIVDLDADIDSPIQGIRTYIPFQGEEGICWECGDQRYLMIDMSLKGKTVGWTDVCGDPFDDTKMHSYKRAKGRHRSPVQQERESR
jgi:hypothetical protein